MIILRTYVQCVELSSIHFISNQSIHTIILSLIMITLGAFGGYLNHLHHFDTDKNRKSIISKSILLGIGSSLLVPAFLKMIASDLIKYSTYYDQNCYLIFGGFCLIAAIFSRRFISTIGEKVLEAAKNAESTSNENKKQIETTKLELTSTQERIEDVKLSVSLKNSDNIDVNAENKLIVLVNSYVEKTSIPIYSDRLKMKAEIGRKMGQIIISNNLNKENLLDKYSDEGMYLALAYSVELSPNTDGIKILNKISKRASQLYTKYVILIAYKTLASSGIINKIQAKEIFELIINFKTAADAPLMRNINDTINILKLIDPEIQKN